MRVERVAGVAVEEVLVVHPEGVLLVAEAEGAVAGEAAVRAPVLHVDGQLVLGLVGDVRQRPDQDVAWERYILFRVFIRSG